VARSNESQGMVSRAFLYFSQENRWMTEKFDGIRLFWDGSAFFSRQGNKIQVPDNLYKKMPKIALDGELW
jgi:DNA ligase-1